MQLTKILGGYPLGMNPVYQRLLEIARELGAPDPVPNRYFEELLGVSSGRVAQIRKPDSVDKVGAKGGAALAMKGYNIDWVNYGHPNKKRLPSSSESTVRPFTKRQSKEISEVIKIMEDTDDAGRGKALAAVRVALMDHRPIRKHRAS